MSLAALYEKDETAWLEQTARLMRHEKYGGIDYRNLGEFLTDMAIREKREIFSRLSVLLIHLLKWDYQPERRARSWIDTIKVQRKELQKLLGRKTLRVHAGDVLDEVYAYAVGRAATQTGLEERQFPERCPYSLNEILQGSA